ncbi:valyl-tRNA synthetase [Planococcus antarcticus DSM 14505]|uniref:Valine--tRNA ligase n=1 Tax=Planococcus antarcticus DSM 14505 TaxID=1185653 RepID=A0AA87IJ02_9BACL|nr:valine--tRNA ligase [Planococcus antarcticus]EIM05631.1 valyl-tRNA synthetase [Planococcus antarcticus DSM 14505]
MTEQMSTKYDPQSIEKGRYDWWVDNKFFEAKPESGKTPYTIVIPPPNVTGKLHLGHAWDTTLQDILTRMKRMQGFDALWLPGMDHAGIATQAKVEGKLKEEGRSRYDLGREAFLEESWKWKDQYAGHIREQWGKLGLGLDYSRERFTLDDGLSKAVREVFVKLYEKKLIYRGKYIINWDPNTQTAISDIEVIYKDVQGAFYHMRYPLADGSGHIEIATTRPETMLGDTAVAVHPKDERYQHLIGKKVILPIIGREMEIVADDYVDMEFGSGAVKITPAHDPNDFEIGNRHNLERVLIMHENGSMNENAGKYEGLDRFECRKQIVKDLQDMDVLFKIEEHLHSVGHSERSGAVVEPYLSTQWFVDMKPLAAASVEAQKNDAGVNFVPDRFEKTYLHWMENIRDWCISRQLWWGHQIPAWYHNETNEIYVGHEAPADAENWTQDEDVLDTWFSSALWPFSTLGWPEENDDLSRYYPTDVLVTGYDIINFWVSRMIFQALEFTGEKPFKDVLIHGLVRDAEGRKMSKSLGNGVDPMDVISEYGADSLRYFLATASSPGQDLRYANDKVESVWNFANKIWNASRFALMNMEGMTYDQIDLSGKKSVADSWILTRLNETIEQVTEMAERYEFGEVGRSLYNFIWDDFCDWYIEMSKLPLYGEDEDAKKMTRSVLAYVLDNTMRLLHPLMPFITEEIWQNLPHQGESITIAAWPTEDESLTDQSQSSSMKLLMDVIRSVRTIRSEVQSPMSKKVPLTISAKDANTHAVLDANAAYIERFCNPETLTIGQNVEAPEKSMSAVISGAELFMPLEGLIDIGAELARLNKELEKWAKEVKLVSGKLSNERFVSKAPEAVVAEERAKQADYVEKHATVEKRIEELQNL